jgi:hypothetical protein
MARADTPTWLSLDEFAQIIGLNPLHFNGFSSDLFRNNTCGDVFFQYDWQHSDRIGRDTIARSIRDAEMEMTEEAGFNLMPDWITEERLDYPKPGIPGVIGFSGQNPRGFMKSVEAKRGHIISGGVKTKTWIATPGVARSDGDGDGYKETAIVLTAVAFTDPSEVHLYYPGMDGADAWEIRPITVSITGGLARISFKSWQIPLRTELEKLEQSPLDAADDTKYEIILDVFRVYNDPGTQLQFMWENSADSCCGCGTCEACQFGTQAGCFHLRDARMGILVPAPGSWNLTDQVFDSSEWTVCREPDQVRLWYYSGYMDHNVARPYAELSPYWKSAVAYFAASKFDRDVCGCSNVKAFINKWRRDAAFVSQEEGGFHVTAESMSNKLGTTMGALYAYKQIHRNGVRVNK